MYNKQALQLTAEGQLRHFLSIEGLPKSILIDILNTAETFVSVGQQAVKKVPLLRGKTIVNLFFENSTRTRMTFELAAKRLSADILNLNINTSATAKGESLLDTLRNLQAMHTDMFIVRHAQSGAAHFIAQYCQSHVSVINAGDGSHAHPTQAMLDMFTIRRYCKTFSSLTVAIIGDVLHSRVARSQIHALTTLGVGQVRVIGPKTIIPADIQTLGAHVFYDMRAGLADVDVIIILRLQRERMHGGFLPSEREYFHTYGLTEKKYQYAKPGALVMHPGPINRGVEIDSKIADGPNSLILQQVSNGIAVRMAIMSMAMGSYHVAQGGA